MTRNDVDDDRSRLCECKGMEEVDEVRQREDRVIDCRDMLSSFHCRSEKLNDCYRTIALVGLKCDVNMIMSINVKVNGRVQKMLNIWLNKQLNS
jgi:hypothetical protein